MPLRPVVDRVVLAAALATGALVPAAAGLAPVGAAHAASAREVAGTVPHAVVGGAALRETHHDRRAVLTVNLGLAVRHSAELDEFIRAASTPGTASYGHYLTNAQYNARFAPTDSQVNAVRGWLATQSVGMTAVSPDHLLITARASSAAFERVFRVTINDYRDQSHAFFANANAPTVPPGLSIRNVSGLDDFSTLRVTPHVAANAANPEAQRVGGYYPSDFRQAYDVGGSGSGQTIGFTLWYAPLPQSDLDAFAAATGSPRLVVGQSGADGIDFVPVNGSSADTSAWIETAMDVEHAHGVAPGSHLTYWLAPSPTYPNLELAVNAAANDANVHVVSNSWGDDGSDTSDPNLETSFQHGAAVGTTFLFSTGDTARIAYPATSPYVVAVGGTTLSTDPLGNYASESAWAGSGGGCSAVFARPAWQTGVTGAATCPNRAVPDVSADGDPATGAYVTYSGGAHKVGGPSLAAPLWAGMLANWNNQRAAGGIAPQGFAAPLVYAFGNDPVSYAGGFHDVTAGIAGGRGAGIGWDEVTGWGSPNLGGLEATARPTMAGFAIGDATALEPRSGASRAVFTLRLDQARAAITSVNFTVGLGGADTATAGVDFAAASGTLSFPAGTVDQTISVPILGDTVPELTERFRIKLTKAVGAPIGDAIGVGTILDNPLPGLAVTVDSVVVDESDSGVQHAVFTVSLSQPAISSTIVTVRTSDGTATVGSDYAALGPIAVTFGPGEQFATIAVSIHGDTIVEGNETARLTITAPPGLTVAQHRGTATIRNND